jgi:hypothetical protein
MDDELDAIKRKRFLLGVCLSWTPFLFLMIPTAIGLISTLRSGEHATGLAATAGGFMEFLATFGLVTIVVFEVAAIVLLLRTFSAGRWRRALLGVVSIGCSGFMLTTVCFFLWLFVFRVHH